MSIKRSRRIRAADVLGPLEAEVMGVIWHRPGSRAAEVTEAVNVGRERPLSYKTILTILTRLETKGWLAHAQDGRAFRYTATMSERKLTALQAERAVEALFDKYGDLAISGFVDRAAASPSRLTRLEDVLARRREGET